MHVGSSFIFYSKCQLFLVIIFYCVLQEPSDNGPLFSELKFYMRAAKPDLSMPLWLQTHPHMHDEPDWKKVEEQHF